MLWEGRFYFSLVFNDEYFFMVYRYIELNFVRVNMVEKLVEYKWLSYRINVLGIFLLLYSFYFVYLNLGVLESQCFVVYCVLFDDEFFEIVINKIKSGI